MVKWDARLAGSVNLQRQNFTFVYIDDNFPVFAPENSKAFVSPQYIFTGCTCRADLGASNYPHFYDVTIMYIVLQADNAVR